MAECLLQESIDDEYVISNDSDDHKYSNSILVSSKMSNKNSKTDCYKQAIPKECVLLIIKLYKEHSGELNGPNKRFEKRNIWNKIARIVQEHGYQMDAAQCSQKWRNMLRDYTVFIERLGQQTDDQPAGNPPWYFLQMADALNERQFLSITDADSTVEGGGDFQSVSVDEGQQPFTIVPIASTIALSGSVRQLCGSSADSLQAVCNTDSDEDLVNGALGSARKRQKVKDESRETRSTTHECKLILKAIKQDEIARKEDADARHVSLLQELRRQHYEKMSVLNKILDALSAQNPESSAPE